MDDPAVSQANAAIGHLIGMPWTSLGRASDLVWCMFGSPVEWHNYKGETTEKSEWALHLQCPFRVTIENRLILSSSDLDEMVARQYEEELSSSESTQVTLFDFKAAELSTGAMLSTVTRAKVSSMGDVVIDLESGLRLETFVVSSRYESWRLLGFVDPESSFVFPEDPSLP